MDSIISLGQKNTLAEYMILSGADNRPPMLDKDLYDSWKRLKERNVIKTKEKYAKLSAAEKIQADCDIKATNIILQGLPADIYSLVNHHRVAKDLWERVQLLMQGTSLTKQERECKLYDAFDKFTHIKEESLHTFCLFLCFLLEYDPFDCLNKAFSKAVASSRATMLIVQGENIQVDWQRVAYHATTATGEGTIWLGNCTASYSGPREWHLEPNQTWGSNATDIPLSSSLVMTGCPDCTLVYGLRIFGNDQIARFMGYGDYQLENVVISRVYYIEGLKHNLFSVGQFCDADLEVAFQKNTCFIRNLEGVDLLSGSQDTNLYTISLDGMLKSSPICLLSKASKTKSWLWHRRLSNLNFGTLNKLAKDGLARGIPRLKFQKDHLYSACALRKSKKSSHQPKAEDTNQEKLYLLHMDLCGPMRVASINGKRRNRTLVEAARTMLIFFKASLFLGAEAINTACYTQNRYLIRLQYNKTPYELMQDKKPDLSFLHIFGSLCYPTNDHEDLGKFDAKADIRIFVGYAPAKKDPDTL
ncbi:integrase, catalytic region, zinc finger, CCHC-type containing protein [Tanacetum coccineum]